MQRGRLRGLLRAAARRGDVRGLRLDAEPLLRRARRPVHAADPPLGGAAVRRLDRRAPAAHLLHRRVPPAAGDQLAASASVMLVLALLEGFTGYSLPDDLLSGTGLRIISAIILSIPVIGTWAHFAVFGGDFLGERDHRALLHRCTCCSSRRSCWRLIALHLLILVKQKHTQFPGPGRTEHNVVGNRLFPTFAVQGDRPDLHRLRRLRGARRPGADQPDLAVGPVQPGAGVRRRRSPTGTSASSTGRPASSRRGTSTCPATTRSRRCSGRPSCIAGLMFTLAGALPDHRAQADRRHRVAPPAAASARRPGAHRRSA